MRLKKFGADLVADFGDVGFRLELGDVEDELAREGIAVGMQAGGRQGDQRVARLDIFAGKQFFALDGADDETSKIVLTGRIKTGHFGSFTANERAAGFAARAAHALDELLDDVGLELAHGEIVEEKERLGALDENVVDAVIDEIAADGGVDAHGHGDFEFGADAIGAGDQHGLSPFFAIEGKERAEAANAAENARSESMAGVMPDALLGFLSDGDIDTGIGVFHEVSSLPVPLKERTQPRFRR